MKRSLVIYHKDCADGFGAAFAAWSKLGDDADYVACSYDESGIPEELRWSATIKGCDVYILDFGFDEALMTFYRNHARRIVWLDHHKSSFEMVGKGEREYFSEGCRGSRMLTILDNNKSGAYLAWEYFHPDREVPMLIKLIDDYDRWQHQINDDREVQRALWSHAPWSFEQWKSEFLDSPEDHTGLSDVGIFQLAGEGRAILRAHNQQVDQVLDKCVTACEIWHRDADLGRLKGLAANAPAHLASDVGHRLAERSGTYGLVWYLADDGQVKCSIRSASDYDVQVIAKMLGGGGHARASGFRTDLETLMTWLRPS